MVFDDSHHILAPSSDRKVTAICHFFGVFCRKSRVAAALLASGLLVLNARCGEASQQYLLRAEPEVNQVRTVKAVLEVRGTLKLNADGKQVTSLPLKVRGDLLYRERILELGDQAVRRDARYYETARASIQVGEGNRENLLRENRRLVVAQSAPEETHLFSPHGPLTRDELELIDVHGNSLLLDQLLPDREVASGETWNHADELVAGLFGLDVVHTNETKSTLRKVDDGVAVIDMQGTVRGAVAGVSSDMELKAVYNFNLAERRVSWFAASIQESRAVGHAQPGFDVTARLRLVSAAGKPDTGLSETALAPLNLNADDSSLLLEFTSNAGGFHFLHDRQWRLMVDRHDVSIMRRIDRGDLIAQCNISSLSNLKAGQQLELGALQADVERALGDNFGEFVEANQTTTASGVRVLRTVAAGAVSELPIQWTYYHFSDSTGRQLSLVFTMDVQHAERFANNDAVIVSSFDFRQRSEPATADGPADNDERQATTAQTSLD